MSISASYVEVLPAAGLKVEAAILPVSRPHTIRYAVTVWAIKGNYQDVIPDGEAMLPPMLVDGIKLKLWEQIKP